MSTGRDSSGPDLATVASAPAARRSSARSSEESRGPPVDSAGTCGVDSAPSSFESLRGIEQRTLYFVGRRTGSCGTLQETHRLPLQVPQSDAARLCGTLRRRLRDFRRDRESGTYD